MGILELILMIYAWKKGWKWMTFLPLALTFLVIFVSYFLVGYGAGISGGNLTQGGLATLKPIAGVCELCMLIALFYMARNKPKPKMPRQEPIKLSLTLEDVKDATPEEPPKKESQLPEKDRTSLIDNASYRKKRNPFLIGVFVLLILISLILLIIYIRNQSNKEVVGFNPPNDKRVEDSSKSSDKELVDFANSINKMCPYMIDKETRLDNVNPFNDYGLQFNYTLINHVKDSLVIKTLNNPSVISALINKIKTSPELKKYRDKNLTWIYTYFDKNGTFIDRITITSKQYGNTTSNETFITPKSWYTKTYSGIIISTPEKLDPATYNMSEFEMSALSKVEMYEFISDNYAIMILYMKSIRSNAKYNFEKGFKSSIDNIVNALNGTNLVFNFVDSQDDKSKENYGTFKIGEKIMEYSQSAYRNDKDEIGTITIYGLQSDQMRQMIKRINGSIKYDF